MNAQEPPKRGDIGWLDLDPTRGTEIKKRRPVLVISPTRYNQATGLIIFCPITNTDRGSKLEIRLANTQTTGVVAITHLKSLDWRARRYEAIEEAPDDILDAALDLISAILLD